MVKKEVLVSFARKDEPHKVAQGREKSIIEEADR